MVAQRQDNTIDMNDVVITIEVGSDVIDKALCRDYPHRMEPPQPPFPRSPSATVPHG